MSVQKNQRYHNTTVIGDKSLSSEKIGEPLDFHGIPNPEKSRAVDAQINIPTPDAAPWPPKITGIDLAGVIDNYKIFASKFPPFYLENPEKTEPYPADNINPYPNNPTPDLKNGGYSNTYNFKNNPVPSSANWIHNANKINSEPTMEGEHGFTVQKSIPEWRYPVEQSQMYPLVIPDVIIPASDGFPIHYTIPTTIPTTIRETIAQIRDDFEWLDDKYIESIKKLAKKEKGVAYLVRAASETITDHRSEGEEYRRKLSGDELKKVARTAIGKKMDINHDSENITDAIIVDSEYNTSRKEIQMILIERDSQVNDAISNGVIDAVSINAGAPRGSYTENCDVHCESGCETCWVPTGWILAELDGIAMTYVITDPNGMYWHGKYISSAKPGIKSTILQKL